MVTLYLARHGQTVDNARHIMQGQTQGELDTVGMEQAKELAAKMQNEPIDVFMSSDLKRAMDTCSVVAAMHGQDIVTTPLLRERDWGGFTGLYIPDLKDRVWPDDIETLDALMLRAGKFLDYLRSDYNSKAVFAVGHGIINKAIQAVLLGKAMKDVMRMENAEVRKLRV